MEKTHKRKKSTEPLVMSDTLKQQPKPLMVILPANHQAKPSANKKQIDRQNKNKRQHSQEGDDSENRVSQESSGASDNIDSDNDFNPAHGSDAGEDDSNHVRDDFSTSICCY